MSAPSSHTGPLPDGSVTGATRAADRLDAAFEHLLGDALRRGPGERVDLDGAGFLVRSHDLVERCPRRAARPADDYEDRVATTRRRVGLLVLRRLWAAAPAHADASWRAAPSSLVATTKEVFDDGDVWPPRLWSWMRSLDRAGRAALAAGAVSWCDGVLRLVGSARDVTWIDPSLPVRRDVPARHVGLAATLDATRRAEDGERLLVITGAVSPTSRRVLAGHAALVRSNPARRDVVTRVTLASPPTGRLDHVVVDDALLDLAVDRVVEHVALRTRPDAAPARPSEGCRHCHLLEDCDAGREHLGYRPGVAGWSAAEPGTDGDQQRQGSAP